MAMLFKRMAGLNFKLTLIIIISPKESYFTFKQASLPEKKSWLS
jgi:hypothetical protein